MATLDEAKCCPRCGNPGQQTASHSGPRGSTVYTFTCRTEGCRWENTGWLVQVQADGTIPERAKGEKQYPGLDPYAQARAKRLIEQIVEEEKRSTGPSQ